jgi:hypothetical protein
MNESKGPYEVMFGRQADPEDWTDETKVSPAGRRSHYCRRCIRYVSPSQGDVLLMARESGSAEPRWMGQLRNPIFAGIVVMMSLISVGAAILADASFWLTVLGTTAFTIGTALFGFMVVPVSASARWSSRGAVIGAAIPMAWSILFLAGVMVYRWAT